MKQMVWLVLLILGSIPWSYAQDSSKAQQMSGTICNAKCVIQTPDHASCDPKCDITGGQSVFINDAGKVDKITNQEKCRSYMGKNVTMTAVPTGLPGDRSVVIQKIHVQP
jgi:hypothetical protein